MKHLSIFIPVYLISIFQVFSKSLPVKTTVVNISNDTNTVYLIDKRPKITPSVFHAAQTPNGNSDIELRPATIKEIRIDSGDYYISAIVHVDMEYSSSIEMSKVYSTDTARKDTIFLRVLIQGPIDLYLFTDVNGKDHFFVKSSDLDFTELIDKYVSSYYVPAAMLEASHVDTSREYLIHISNFHEELSLLMKDCPEVASKINSLEYKERPIVKLFLAYMNCKNGNMTYVTPVKTATPKLAVVAGVSMTKIQFIGEETSIYMHLSSELHLSSFPVSTDPVVGLKVILPLNRTNDMFSFHSSLLWWNYDTKSNYMNEYGNEYFIHLRSDYLKIVLGPALKFNLGRLQPFASTGFNGMLLLHMINDRDIVYNSSFAPSSSPSAYQGEDVAYYHPSKTDGGFYGSLGVIYNRFTFDARYNLSKGMASSVGMTTPVSSFEFLLSYSLLK